MIDVKNPAKSRPLSANVRRLMKMARESPQNGDVEKIGREFRDREIAYCDMQGNIFMAAIDKGMSMRQFAPKYMNSQVAGIMDYSFSCAGGLEDDETVQLLKVPLLVKSPELIVEAILWIEDIVRKLEQNQSPSLAVMQAYMSDEPTRIAATPMSKKLASGQASVADGSKVSAAAQQDSEADAQPVAEQSLEALADEYEYAYWLGYIYRYECLLHEESSRMVYGAFSEEIMQKSYREMMDGGLREESLTDCAGEVCKRLDMMLVGKLWK